MQEKPRLHQVIKAISEGLSEEGISTLLVIPPGVRPFPEIFDKHDFQILQPYVEKFVMMTYDHHHATGKAGSFSRTKKNFDFWVCIPPPFFIFGTRHSVDVLTSFYIFESLAMSFGTIIFRSSGSYGLGAPKHITNNGT